MKNKVLRKALAVSLAAAMMFGTGFTTAGQFIGTNVSVSAKSCILGSAVYYDPDAITTTKTTLSGSGTFPAGSFGGYTFLQDVVISENVVLPAEAFKGKTSLKSVAFTGTTTKIPTSAFQGCTGITFVNYGNVTTIGESAFNGCTAYTDLSYATKVTSVGKSAFYGCSKLSSVALPNVKTIGEKAFSTCKALKTVDIGSKVTSIGASAFSQCSALKSITLPKTVTSIGTNAFASCPNLVISGYAGSTAETYAWNNGKNFNYLDHTNVTSVSLQSLSVEQGKTATITATVSPSNAYKKTLKWSSNNTNVATVNGSGVVTAVGAGTATITAKSHNGKTATCTVTVTAPVLATGISLNKTSTALQNGQSETLTATITPSNATNKAVTWSSNNTSVATVNNGTVTAVGAGTATITATTSNGISASCQVTISQEVVEVTGISLNKTSASIAKGSSETLTATITPSNATNKAVTWSSSNTSVATVSGGKVTAVSAGTATITAKSNNGKTATCTVTVKAILNKFVWQQDNWNFNNWYDYFSRNTYREQISSEYLNKLKENLENDEYQAVFVGSKESVAWLDSEWKGSCYGMSATTLLSKEGLLPYSRYHSGASNLNQLDIFKDKDVISLIDYYQMLQVKRVTQNQFRSVPKKSHEENIKQILSLLDESSTVMVGFKQVSTGKAHEILAYGYEYGSWTKDGVTYGGRIKICDPNRSSNNYANYDEVYIYFNPETYSWAIPLYISDWRISSAYGATFNHICSNVDEINEGGYLMSSENDRQYAYVARLDAYKVADNRSVAKVQTDAYGTYMNMSANPGEIEEAYSYVMQGNDSNGTKGYNLYDAQSAYKIIQYDPVDMQLSLEYEDCTLYGGSAAGKFAIFDNDGYVEVHGEPSDYDLGIVSNNDYPTDWFAVQVCGSGAKNSSLRKTNDGYVLSSDNLKNVSVKVNNKENNASLDFSTIYESVLIYEIDENAIGLKVDTDGNGTYETDITNQAALKNNSVISAETINLGDSVTVNAKATGGTGSYTYAVYYKQTSQSSWTTAQGYKANSKVTFTPAKAVVYDVCVKVKDSSGTEVKKYFIVTVTAGLQNKSVLSATEISLGGSITAKCSATGGTGSYKYNVLYKQVSQSSWTTAQSYNSNASVTFTPGKATDYDVCVKVKDSAGKEVKKYFTVTITAGLRNKSVLSETEIRLGDSVTVNAKASGGTGSYKYNILYKQVSQSSWTTAQSYSSNASVTFTPAKATDYDVCVKVKDSSGTVTKKYFTVTVMDSSALSNTSKLSATTISLGSSVSVKCSASGGTGFYQYAVYYKKTSESKWTVQQSYASNASVSVKPSTATTYDICVKVKDSDGSESKKYFKVTVK